MLNRVFKPVELEQLIIEGIETNILCIGHDGLNQHFIDIVEEVWIKHSPLLEMLDVNSKICRECKKFEEIDENTMRGAGNCQKWFHLSKWDSDINGYSQEKNCSYRIDKPDYIQHIIINFPKNTAEATDYGSVDHRIEMYSNDDLTEIYITNGGALPSGTKQIVLCVGRFGRCLLGCF